MSTVNGRKELKLDLSTFPVLQMMCLCDHLVISVSSQWSKGVLLGVSGSTQNDGGESLEEFPCCWNTRLVCGLSPSFLDRQTGSL